jgi:hypothetical protein
MAAMPWQPNPQLEALTRGDSLEPPHRNTFFQRMRKHLGLLWNALKARAAFCKDAFWSEFLRRKRYRVMTILSALSIILTFVGPFVDLHVGLPHWSWKLWLVAVFIWLVISLLLVLEAVYRLHARTVNDHERGIKEMTVEHEALIAHWRGRCTRIERLAHVLGMAYQVYNDLDSKRPVLRDSLLSLDGSINQALHSCFNDRTVIEDYYSKQALNSIPNTPREQEQWVDSHCFRLRRLIDKVRNDELSSSL